MKVLIVDDEYLIRFSLQKLLEREGHEVRAAASARETLDLFEAWKPDIIILDVRLPDTNGMTLLKVIKERSPSSTVIMATGSPSVLSRIEAMNMGALDYLEKPVDIESLIRMISSGQRQCSAKHCRESRQCPVHHITAHELHGA